MQPPTMRPTTHHHPSRRPQQSHVAHSRPPSMPGMVIMHYPWHPKPSTSPYLNHIIWRLRRNLHCMPMCDWKLLDQYQKEPRQSGALRWLWSPRKMPSPTMRPTTHHRPSHRPQQSHVAHSRPPSMPGMVIMHYPWHRKPARHPHSSLNGEGTDVAGYHRVSMLTMPTPWLMMISQSTSHTNQNIGWHHSLGWDCCTILPNGEMHCIDCYTCNGIIFNLDKFHFTKSIVDFGGFSLTPTWVKPSIQMLPAIVNFPVPSNITGVKSWFGLMNQVDFRLAVAPVMQPFRDFLKANSWYWGENLSRTFNESHSHIIKKIKDGVCCYEVGRPTCLSMDWI